MNSNRQIRISNFQKWGNISLPFQMKRTLERLKRHGLFSESIIKVGKLLGLIIVRKKNNVNI